MNTNRDHTTKIGIFDSGVGGLSVLKAIQDICPCLQLLYVADQAHVPYGRREMDEIREFSESITRFLLEQGAELIVVACNTASAAALKHLRQTFPEIPIVGMEPAVKPAAEITKSKAIGILATPATFQGELYHSLVEKYGDGLRIFQDTCPGLVAQIEAGALREKKTRSILEDALEPMLLEKIDAVVLGCTHYPFVLPLIEEIVGQHVTVIDPAPAVARRAAYLLGPDSSKKTDCEEIPTQPIFFTSGNAHALKTQIQQLLELDTNTYQLSWIENNLHIN